MVRQAWQVLVKAKATQKLAGNVQQFIGSFGICIREVIGCGFRAFVENGIYTEKTQAVLLVTNP